MLDSIKDIEHLDLPDIDQLPNIEDLPSVVEEPTQKPISKKSDSSSIEKAGKNIAQGAKEIATDSWLSRLADWAGETATDTGVAFSKGATLDMAPAIMAQLATKFGAGEDIVKGDKEVMRILNEADKVAAESGQKVQPLKVFVTDPQTGQSVETKLTPSELEFFKQSKKDFEKEFQKHEERSPIMSTIGNVAGGMMGASLGGSLVSAGVSSASPMLGKIISKGINPENLLTTMRKASDTGSALTKAGAIAGAKQLAKLGAANAVLDAPVGMLTGGVTSEGSFSGTPEEQEQIKRDIAEKGLIASGFGALGSVGSNIIGGVGKRGFEYATEKLGLKNLAEEASTPIVRKIAQQTERGYEGKPSIASEAQLNVKPLKPGEAYVEGVPTPEFSKTQAKTFADSVKDIETSIGVSMDKALTNAKGSVTIDAPSIKNSMVQDILTKKLNLTKPDVVDLGEGLEYIGSSSVPKKINFEEFDSEIANKYLKGDARAAGLIRKALDNIDDPKEYRNALTELDNRIAEYKMGMGLSNLNIDAYKILKETRDQLKNKLAEAVPEFKLHSDRFSNLRKNIQEQVLSLGGKDVRFKDLGDSKFQKFEDGLINILNRVSDPNKSSLGALEANSQLQNGLQKFAQDELGLLKSGQIKSVRLPSFEGVKTVDPKNVNQSLDQIRKELKLKSDFATTYKSLMGGALEGNASAEKKLLGTAMDVSTSGIEGFGLGAAHFIGRTAKGLENVSNALNNLPNEKIASFAKTIQKNKTFAPFGKRLEEAAISNNGAAKNAALFVIMQNPKLREFLFKDPELSKEIEPLQEQQQ
jgi:hypothetical protein